jgi:hypothetical protein
MQRGAPLRLILFFTSLAVMGCQVKIGHDCVTDLDCSQVGDRTCDTTQPGGYCTQVDCDPTSCPEKESSCVAFNNTPSTVGACNTPDRVSPFRRTFCMQTCKDSGDCRREYECVDLAEPNPWSAAVIQDVGPKKNKDVITKVCMLAQSHPEIEETRSDQVCSGPSDSGIGAAGSGSN